MTAQPRPPALRRRPHLPHRPKRPKRPFAGGFSAVEVLCTCAVAAVVVTLALPSFETQLHKARRSDAVAALTRLQAAQERQRAAQGLYSGSLAALQIESHSADGLYLLALETRGPDGYVATATAVPGHPQARDTDCPELALEVNNGFAQVRPDARCWNR